MSNASMIKIYEKNTQNILFQYDISDADEAYHKAASLEEMGIEIDLEHPSVTQTLCETLGLSVEQNQEYEQSVIAEIEDHDGSCCHTNTEQK